MVGVVRVYDGMIPVDNIDSIRFKKYSDSEEIRIYTIGGKEYYISTAVLNDEEENMIATLVLNSEVYVDLRDLVKNVINSREVGE